MIKVADWFKRARKGDGAAYAEQFRLYEGDIYRMAYVYVKNQQDALDVVQETAYRSYKSLAGLKDRSYFKTWLIRIAIRVSIDLLRERGRKQTTPLDEAAAVEPQAPEEDIPLALTLQDMLNTLNDEEKSIILLRFYQDCTIKETADMLHMPLGSVKTVLYRALHKLRKQTEEVGFHE